MRREDKRFWTE